MSTGENYGLASFENRIFTTSDIEGTCEDNYHTNKNEGKPIIKCEDGEYSFKENPCRSNSIIYLFNILLSRQRYIRTILLLYNEVLYVFQDSYNVSVEQYVLN